MGYSCTPYHSVQSCALERSLQLRCIASTKHGEQQLHVISHPLHLREIGARCRFRRWEKSPYIIGQLPPPPLMQGSPQSVRCCPTTVRQPCWVHTGSGYSNT
ncbi:hypothetical protein DPMN_087748 [Dreissena polymorpha]|uniref:Uncharacterized protein n=1 Tax=Dreissena polymorpha TaxID=45954 RepID=A0A9D4KSS2_DREPO|nr:hypothetical protein DPMN_087688 [Dreissena polymorpha]KAH3845467.1 hypothetical protein DPMN_087748 [Dreissena polymorpha]